MPYKKSEKFELFCYALKSCMVLMYKCVVCHNQKLFKETLRILACHNFSTNY